MLDSKNITKRLEEIFILQDKVNTKIDINWYANRSLEDWSRAMWAECGELMESLPWKWWSVPNKTDIRIEIVDILHFLLSYILQQSNGLENVMENPMTQVLIKTLNKEVVDKDL